MKAGLFLLALASASSVFGAVGDTIYRIPETLILGGGAGSRTISGQLVVKPGAASDGFLSASELRAWNWTATGDTVLSPTAPMTATARSDVVGQETILNNIRITPDRITLLPSSQVTAGVLTRMRLASNSLGGVLDYNYFNPFGAGAIPNGFLGFTSGDYFNNYGGPPSTAFGGDPWIFGVRLGTDDGNDRFFVLEAADVLGDGITETNDLGALHRGYVDSFGGIGLQTEFSELTRQFTFQSGSGGTDPVSVYVHGLVEGLMAADNFGRASIESSLVLEDTSGNEIESGFFNIEIDSDGIVNRSANVYEEYGFGAVLTPGQDYVLRSRLSIDADGHSFGRGLVDLRNTFEYQISGLAENPFADPTQETVIEESPIIPEMNASWILGLAMIVPLLRRR